MNAKLTTRQKSPEPADENACCCWATSRNACPVHGPVDEPQWWDPEGNTME